MNILRVKQTPRCLNLACLSGLLLGLAMTVQVAVAQQTPVPVPGPAPQAPPPAPPIEVRPPTPAGGTPPHLLGLTPYSIGQPTDEEQLYLEYINRSRANPTAEGQRLATTTDPDVLSAYSYFSVDLNLMQYEFSTNPPVPPLAMNAKLMAAARLHSGDMYTNVYQGHDGTDGSSPGTRISAQGYSWFTYGENVYASAESVFYGHAGFNVDWGYGPGGMQNPPGHRNSIHNALFREVGVGVVNGTNSSGGSTVGPQLVTQDFGAQNSNTPFITGVVYYDFNGNGFYDLGEGIGGVHVDSPGSTYYAITPDSGGYALPVTTNGNYRVAFIASGLSHEAIAAVTGQKNVKVDYIPAYSPPVISGPNPAYLNQNNTYTFTPVGAATTYDWQQTQLNPYTYVEGAENGFANVTVVSSPGYSVLASDVKASGSYSFHLTHLQPDDQLLTLNSVVRVNSTSQLSFAKRLGVATPDEIARGQISVDGGQTWQDLWSQQGDDSGEPSFSTVTVPLGAYAQQSIQVRFVFEFHSGMYYPTANSGYGLYLDNISISNAQQTSPPVVSNIPSGTTFTFSPSAAATYLLQVRAQVAGRTLLWGPGLTVTTASLPPSIQLLSDPTLAAGQIQLDFTVNNYSAGTTFQLWKTADLGATWTQDTSAGLQTVVANSQFRFTTSTGAAKQTFYRVRASY